MAPPLAPLAINTPPSAPASSTSAFTAPASPVSLFLFDASPASPISSTSTSRRSSLRRRPRSSSTHSTASSSTRGTAAGSATSVFFASSFSASPPAPLQPPARKGSTSTSIAVETPVSSRPGSAEGSAGGSGFVFMGGDKAASPPPSIASGRSTPTVPRKRPSLLTLGSFPRSSPTLEPAPSDEDSGATSVFFAQEDVVMSSPTLEDAPTYPNRSESPISFTDGGPEGKDDADEEDGNGDVLPVRHVPLHRSEATLLPKSILVLSPISDPSQPSLSKLDLTSVPSSPTPSFHSLDARSRPSSPLAIETPRPPRRPPLSQQRISASLARGRRKSCTCRTCRSFASSRFLRDSDDDSREGTNRTTPSSSDDDYEEEGDGEEGSNEEGSVFTAQTSPAISTGRPVCDDEEEEGYWRSRSRVRTQSAGEGEEGWAEWRVRFCEAAAEEIVTWPATSYDRRGPPPVAKLTMRDVLELREVKESLGVATPFLSSASSSSTSSPSALTTNAPVPGASSYFGAAEPVCSPGGGVPVTVPVWSPPPVLTSMSLKSTRGMSVDEVDGGFEFSMG